MIGTFGRAEVFSFHATKFINSFEGGAIVTDDDALAEKLRLMQNFGFAGYDNVVYLGTNGKMTEIQAAFGMLQLRHIADAIERRRRIDERYRELLAGVQGISVLPVDATTEANYAYFPIFVGDDYPLSRDGLHQRLRDNGIIARRYFFPLVSEFPMYRALPSAAPENLPVAMAISRSVICLPIYPDLDLATVDEISCLIVEP